jgi:hypothetical protein
MCKLTLDFAPVDCTTLEIGGVSGKAYGINYADWLTANITTAPDGTISAIVLTETGAKAVEYDLPRGASVPSTPLTVNNGGKSGFSHTIEMFVPTKAQDFKNEIMANVNYSRMVWIIVLDSGIVAQVFGNDVGLVLSAYDELPNDPSKGGGLMLTWATPTDVTLENKAPVTFGDGDRATTLAALEALTVAVP